ncbi:hypothetical protein DVH05_014206 [Phytophthora capsici]|nr:hypothetical protein DVH05_014206 [Phytophthora capsici]
MPPRNSKRVSKSSKGPKATQKPTKVAKFFQTTDVQLRAMVEWLEVESNYKIIKGEATVGKSIVHGAGITKIEGF